MKVSSLESRLEQGRETLVGKEAQIRQLRVSKFNGKKQSLYRHLVYFIFNSTLQSELERVQQSSARTSSTLQSLRQQLAEAEDGKQSSGSSLAELQTEIGRLRKELKDKVGLANLIQQTALSGSSKVSEQILDHNACLRL